MEKDKIPSLFHLLGAFREGSGWPEKAFILRDYLDRLVADFIVDDKATFAAGSFKFDLRECHSTRFPRIQPHSMRFYLYFCKIEIVLMIEK